MARHPDSIADRARVKLEALKAERMQGAVSGLHAVPAPSSIIPLPLREVELDAVELAEPSDFGKGYRHVITITAEKLAMGYASGTLHLRFRTGSENFNALDRLLTMSDGFELKVALYVPSVLVDDTAYAEDGEDGEGDDDA